MAKKRTVLRLKDEFINQIVTVEIPKLGKSTFDTRTTPANEYENMARCAFDFCFESVEMEQATADEVEALKEAMAGRKIEELKETEDDEESKDTDDGPANEPKPKSTPKPRGKKVTKDLEK